MRDHKLVFYVYTIPGTNSLRVTYGRDINDIDNFFYGAAQFNKYGKSNIFYFRNSDKDTLDSDILLTIAGIDLTGLTAGIVYPECEVMSMFLEEVTKGRK